MTQFIIQNRKLSSLNKYILIKPSNNILLSNWTCHKLNQLKYQFHNKYINLFLNFTLYKNKQITFISSLPIIINKMSRKGNNKIITSNDKQKASSSPNPISKQQKIKNIIESTNAHLYKSLQDGQTRINNPQETAENIINKSNRIFFNQLLMGKMQISQQTRPFQFKNKNFQQVNQQHGINKAHQSRNNNQSAKQNYSLLFPQIGKFNNIKQHIKQTTEQLVLSKQLAQQQNKNLQQKAKQFIQKMKRDKIQFNQKIKQKKSISRVLLRAYSQDTIRIMKNKIQERVQQKRKVLLEKITSIQKRKLSRLASQAQNEIQHWQRIKKIQSTKLLPKWSNLKSYSSQSGKLLLPQIQHNYFSLQDHSKNEQQNMLKNLRSKQVLFSLSQNNKIQLKNSKPIELNLSIKSNQQKQKSLADSTLKISPNADKFLQLDNNIMKAKLKLEKIKQHQIRQNNQAQNQFLLNQVMKKQNAEKIKHKQTENKIINLIDPENINNQNRHSISSRKDTDLQEDLLQSRDILVNKQQNDNIVISGIKDTKKQQLKKGSADVTQKIKLQNYIQTNKNKLLTKKMIPYYQCQQQKPTLQIRSTKSIPSLGKNQFHLSLKQSWKDVINKISNSQMEEIKGLGLLAEIQKRLDKFDKEGIIDRLKIKADIIHKKQLEGKHNLFQNSNNLSQILSIQNARDNKPSQIANHQKKVNRQIESNNSNANLQTSQNEFITVEIKPAQQKKPPTKNTNKQPVQQKKK